jgi:hypothetical protein
VRLEDHLLIEFAHTDGLALAVGKEDAVEATVGDGASVENGQAGCAVAGSDDVADAVPGEAGTQFGKFIRGVASAQQVEDAFKGGTSESAERGGVTDEFEEGVYADFGLWVLRG